MASRLDKLFDLLESNNQSIRSAASIQIGKLSTNSQVQIPSLLKKLLPYVKHKTWSVRIAAADAVKYIGVNSKLWVPNVSNLSITKTEDLPEMISLEKLNLLEILKIGTRLYSTDMRELDETNADASICQDELSRHLGFIIPEECEIKSLLNSEDLELHKSKEENKISIENAVKTSLRNSNRKCYKRSHSEATDTGEPDVKVKCLVKSEQSIVSLDDNADWPWVEFCDALLIDLWNAKWEIRHGAATALRELVRSQGSVMVGRNGNNLSRSDYSNVHVRYQEEVVGRLLCTLALDQLSDFVSDEMVAPVRESCAQVLGIMSIHLPDSLVMTMGRNLLSLLEYSEWTVNHGALLGLKYLIAARIDMADTLLPLFYGPISSHLKDSCDDDVRCAAAAALMPIFARPGDIALQPAGQLDALRLDLWHLLALRPDYTSPGATIAVLQLLEKLYERGGVDTVIDKQIANAFNRLHWCYYSYSDAVRLAAVRTCDALLRSIEPHIGQLSWPIVSQVLCQLFQRVLVEESGPVACQAEKLWSWLVDHLSCEALAQSCLDRLDVWMCCTMQPARLSYAPGALLLPADSDLEDGSDPVATPPNVDDCKLAQLPKEYFIGGRDSFLAEGDSPAREDAVLRARTAACRLLARLCRVLSRIGPLAEHILVTIIARIHLKERLAVQRFVAATILAYWQPAPDWVAQETTMLAPLRLQLLAAIEEPIYYQELLPAFRQMAKSCRDLQACYSTHNVTATVGGLSSSSMNLVQCQSLVTPELCARLVAAAGPDAETMVSCARTSVELCGQQHAGMSRLVETALGRALLEWGWLPDLLTPLIRPLTDTVRCEVRTILQAEAAVALAQLVVDYSFVSRLGAPVGKLLRNIVQYHSDAIDALSPATSLAGPQEVVALHKISQFGREPFPCQEDIGICLPDNNSHNNGLTMATIKLRGARLALEKMCVRLATDGSDCCPVLQRLLCTQPMEMLTGPSSTSASRGPIIAALRATAACLSQLKLSPPDIIIEYGRCVFQHGLCHEDAVVRHWSARVLATLIMPATDEQVGDDRIVQCSRELLDSLLLGEAVEALDSVTNDYKCLGAIELLYLVLHRGWLPYRLALVVPVLPVVLRCLSAPIDAVRRVATHAFSLLLSLLPLEQATADTSILTMARRQQRQASLQFTDGLLNPDSLPAYDWHETAVTASLRHYQRQGLNWLGFLNRYGLHGVLADDMGLGKTLQSICIIVGEHCRRQQDKSVGKCAPSLVVCPPTLTSHWQQEIARHVALPNFASVVYAGPVEARLALFQTLHRYQIIITSYDILRNDIDRLSRPPSNHETDTDSEETTNNVWNYIVLDEGHLIRNHKSKIAIAAKAVCAKHRLVLTGTPIQNRVAELWSLFDFLMPGLLGGTHADFHRRYGRLLDHAAIGGAGTTGNGSVSNGRKQDNEAGTIALEQLHRQVLPFMLRRLKEDVLHELPPKIIQDYMCTMTSVQARLYAHCVAATDNIDELQQQLPINNNNDVQPHKPQPQHVFQALHNLRLVCNHPKLALIDGHPLSQSIKRELANNNQSLDDISLSGKLVALKQLILDCGVGIDDSGTAATGIASSGFLPCDALICSPAGVVSSHRLLVFCQSRSMISVVEMMFRSDIPKASYLRLDGSISIKDRQNIVDKFNQDASIDILLLTTSIGGLGLNLTTADIVIFVEHDWNPMRDLQAMDRAHRIGQKHTVNVYRLITADSIEEKIMSLQKFKMFIANNVVSSDNKQMASMNTDNLLDIMDKEAAGSAATGNNKNSNPNKSGLKPVLSRLEGVYDSLDEYGEEYNLESFVKKL